MEKVLQEVRAALKKGIEHAYYAMVEKGFSVGCLIYVVSSYEKGKMMERILVSTNRKCGYHIVVFMEESKLITEVKPLAETEIPGPKYDHGCGD